MSEKEIKTKYKGLKITYRESSNTWECDDFKDAESLAKMKEKIDSLLNREKNAKEFQKVIILQNHSKVAFVEGKSKLLKAEAGYYDEDDYVWTVYSGSRSKIKANDVFLDTPGNRMNITAWVERIKSATKALEKNEQDFENFKEQNHAEVIK